MECRDADKRFTGGLALPSTIPTTIQVTKSTAESNASFNAD
jgi:hypothetical protein